jgi:hypothetical protein
LLDGLVGLQQRFLDNIGRIELGFQARIQLNTGQQEQVIAVLLQLWPLRLRLFSHASRLS